MKKFIPAMKATIAKQLFTYHGFTQTEIASKLNLTQATVSNYLSGNYGDELKKLERHADVQKISTIVSLQIFKDKIHSKKVSESICDFCIDYLKENPKCEFRNLVKMAVK